MIYKIAPYPKPRMTQRDRWLDPPRDCVRRYKAFKQLCAIDGVRVPYSGAQIVFHIQMPASWSKKKKSQYDGMPHQGRGDLDNFLKALFDSAVNEKDDRFIWQITCEKRWAYEGAIEINNGG